MKILVFSNTFYPNVGGVESNTETLIQALQDLKNPVTLITETQLNGKPELKAVYPISRSKSFYNIFKITKNSELVIVNGDISLPVCFIAFLLRVPYIIIYQMAGAIVPKKKGIFHKLLFFVKLYLGKNADMHIGVSNAALLSKNIIKKRQSVLYNPISKELSELSKSEEIKAQPKKYDILFAGRVIEGKGINTLFDALSILDKKNLNFNVLISGEGEEKNSAIKRAASFTNIKVHFQNFVKGKDLAKTYAKSRVMVLPSTSHQEGSPLSIAEAFFFSVPVIVSNQNAMTELMEKRENLYFTLGDSRELSEKIVSIFHEDIYKSSVDFVNEKVLAFHYDSYVSSLQSMLKDFE